MSGFDDGADAGQTGSLSRRGFLSTATAGTTTLAAAGGERTPKESANRNGSSEGSHEIDRAFVRLREGLVHYRSCGELASRHASGNLPLYMVHAGPGSSLGMAPLMQRLAAGRATIAADSLGAGDSAAPDVPAPDVAYYAESVVRILDTLKIPKIDFYGAHTGAHIGVELALRWPARVRKLALDGVTLFSEELKAELLAKYAPPMEADDFGRQLPWAWQFIRDMSLFFPHYARDPAHRLSNGVQSAEGLNRGVVDVLKVLKTYHLGYHAVFRHDIRSRLPLLTHPVLCMGSEQDPVTQYLDEAATLIPGAKKVRLARTAGLEGSASTIEAFLA